MENGKKQKTIYDISQLAGVSIATVSRVINNSPKVSENTKERVRLIMNELDYEPNVFARGLGTGSMKTIGILCADVADIYLANAVSYLERELRQQGFNSILNCTGYSHEAKEKGLRAMEAHKADAVIMVGSQYIESSAKLNEYIKNTAKNIPVMLLNGYLKGDNIYSILSDDESAFREATEKLIAEGRRNIAFLYREETYSKKNKFEGYLRALGESEVEYDPNLVCRSNTKIQKIKKDLEELFASEKKIDAILACDDELAIGALKFLQMKKIAVPEDISLIGCNNSVLSICCEPELSSVDNMCESLCIGLVNMLMRVLEQQKAPQKTVISCELVERNTTLGGVRRKSR